MKQTLGVLIAGLLVLGSIVSLIAKTISYEETVTTIVFDNDDTGAQLLMRSDDYNGSGQASYTGSRTLTSDIQSNGSWRLQFSSMSGRALGITPNDPINNSQPPAPPAGYYSQSIEAYSECRDQNGNIVPFENLVNGSGNCSLGVDFISGGIEYKLLMSPSGIPPAGASCPPTGCPATGLANVACNGVSNNACVSWTITTNTAIPNATVANLYSYTGNSRQQPWAFIGQYRNTFRINVSHP